MVGIKYMSSYFDKSLFQVYQVTRDLGYILEVTSNLYKVKSWVLINQIIWPKAIILIWTN